MGGGQLMKTTIHCDERITNIRNTIYVKLFWGIIILDNLTNLLDYFFQTSLNGWLFALCYSSLNSITIFVMSSQIDTFFYLELINQRIIVSLIFLTVYFLVTLLFFYISYRIALRKINKLSTDI